MQIKQLFIVSILAGIALVSCNKEDEAAPVIPAATSLLPLGTNNSWTYIDSTDQRYYGNYDVSSHTMTFPNNMTKSGISGFSGKAANSTDPLTSILYSTDGDVHEAFFSNDTLIYNTTIWKKNVKKGDKWKYKSAVYTNGDRTHYKLQEREITCIAVDTLIWTPKGVFKCYGYKYTPTTFEEDTMVHFLADGIGIVKILHYEGTHLFNWSTLKDYKIE